MCLNHKQLILQHPIVPEFGHIKRIFTHDFGEQKTLFAEADVFDSVQFDSDLDMWFTQLQVKHSALFPLDNFSEPLVIAVDKNNSFIWFINYHYKFSYNISLDQAIYK